MLRLSNCDLSFVDNRNKLSEKFTSVWEFCGRSEYSSSLKYPVYIIQTALSDQLLWTCTLHEMRSDKINFDAMEKMFSLTRFRILCFGRP